MLFRSADAAPAYDRIANFIAEGFIGEGATALVPAIDENSGDWDVLYPFSQVRLCPHPLSDTRND